MKKFALAVKKVNNEGGSGSADEGLTSPKKGEKEPDAASIREQKKLEFEDVTRLAVDRVKPWLTHIVCP